MVEMILPGTYIEVRPEGLITPGRVTVGNLGVVGTASKGEIDKPVVLGSYAEAREEFGDYDAWNEGQGKLTLVRALEQAFSYGATTVWAVRIAKDAVAAEYTLASPGGNCCKLTAKTKGEWGNQIEVNVWNAENSSFVRDEKHNGGGDITLNCHDIVESARNRISVFIAATQRTKDFDIVYDGAAAAGRVLITRTTGALSFAAGEKPVAGDQLTASYLVAAKDSVKVVLRCGNTEESYTVASGHDLVADLEEQSVLVKGEPLTNAGELPKTFDSVDDFRLFGTGTNQRGDNGANGASYKDGLDKLLYSPAHIIVAAGQSHTDIGADLANHCKVASDDLNKRERIGIVGSGPEEALDAILGHKLDSDRLVFVAPGIQAIDASTGQPVTLPGTYTAAAIAGLIASYPAHVSLTNKPLPVRGLEQTYTNAELKQLVQNRVLALQDKLGYRVLKGITTATNTAWTQITTRRIVDYAKFGVRSAADPYIGRLNNERVRGAMRATINSFLAEMVEDEMLISYELDVTATRDDERKGIAKVTIVLRPVFSIDFIKVTMFLE